MRKTGKNAIRNLYRDGGGILEMAKNRIKSKRGLEKGPD